MDIEKLKTDSSLWPDGAEFYVICAGYRWFVKYEGEQEYRCHNYPSSNHWWKDEYSWLVEEYVSRGFIVIDRPKEQKVEELKPRDLACFEQVAKVIGEENTEIELQKVIDATWLLSDKKGVGGSFLWNFTDQGFKFWESISKGINPYELSEKTPQKSDKECCKTVEISKELQDVYSILISFKITNPAEQEAIKLLEMAIKLETK